MVHSTSPRPLVIIPHGDFENQVTQRLDDALASGLIKQAKYRDLCNDLQWVLPFQQAQFHVHLNDQIPSPQSHLSNSNVQPSSAASAIQFTVNIDPATNESGDYITTHDPTKFRRHLLLSSRLHQVPGKFLLRPTSDLCTSGH